MNATCWEAARWGARLLPGFPCRFRNGSGIGMALAALLGLALGNTAGCRPLYEVPQEELMAKAVRAAAQGRCPPPMVGTLQDIDATPAAPYFIHHPEKTTDQTPTVLFLPGGAGTRTIARDYIWKNWLARGRRLNEVRVIIPYVPDRSHMTKKESLRTLEILEEVLACYGGKHERVQLAGTSNGGRHAFNLMTLLPQRFASLLGAPGVFPKKLDDAQLAAALRERAVYNGVGAQDDDWKPEVKATHERLTRLGARSVYVEFPGQGHILNEQFDPSPFFDFWLDGPLPTPK